jgi:hypothetical protein
MDLDFHVITPAGSVYICSLVGRRCTFTPQVPQPSQPAPAVAPAQPEPGK